MKRLFFPLLPILPIVLLGMITALAAGPAKTATHEAPRKALAVTPVAPERARPDSIRLRTEKLEHRIAVRDRREALVSLGNRIKNPAAIDTLRGLSREEKVFLRRRYQILHPLD
jgi:IS5 family transposase